MTTGAFGAELEGFQQAASTAENVLSILARVSDQVSIARDQAQSAAEAARSGSVAPDELRDAALNEAFVLAGAFGASVLSANPLPVLGYLLGQFIDKVILADEWGIGYATTVSASCAPDNHPCSEYERLPLACKLSFEDWWHWIRNAAHPDFDYWSNWIIEKTGAGQDRVLSQPASWESIHPNRREELRAERELLDDPAYALQRYRAEAEPCLKVIGEEAARTGNLAAQVAAEQQFGGRFIDGVWLWSDELYQGVPVSSIPLWIPLGSDSIGLRPQYWFAWQQGADAALLETIAARDPIDGLAPRGSGPQALPPSQRRQYYANAAVIAAAKAAAHESIYEEAFEAINEAAGLPLSAEEIRSAWERQLSERTHTLPVGRETRSTARRWTAIALVVSGASLLLVCGVVVLRSSRGAR